LRRYKPLKKGRPSKAVKILAASGGRKPEALSGTQVLRLSERFLELRRQLFRDAVDTAIELGEILEEGKGVLPRAYGRWLDRLGVTRATANNYVRLAVLARDEPGVIQSWKELGSSKLYRVASLTTRGRKSVLKGRQSSRLLDMTQKEFTEFTAPYMRLKRKTSPDQRAHGLRMKVRSWSEDLHGTPLAGVRNQALRESLREDLETLRGLVEDALKRL